jgi:hypothetical protein
MRLRLFKALGVVPVSREILTNVLRLVFGMYADVIVKIVADDKV